ncbi:hypothetical protein [Streptomyces formicae]|uniref:Extracellular nuclease n=1 Tax=Streptomyces formicae TaxID=1616117 RepID=A0ABY3WST1_9ACTN|nr:hypothetical protein [Streptomyces formicae]UNM15704.1 hypothetical protein J4032_33395 [Streptomyces formicae]
MLERAARTVPRRWALAATAVTAAATVGVTAGAVGTAGADPAGSTARTMAGSIVVDCTRNPTALQRAIDSAVTKSELKVRGTCIGPFTIDKSLSLIGDKQAVLDGNFQGPTVTVNGGGSLVLLKKLTITNGAGNATDPAGLGGGILNNNGNVTLSDSTVRHNTAGSGGGIANNDDNPADAFTATVNVIRSTVRHNTATERGGGIFNNNGTVTLSRSTVRHNISVDGGGIYNDGNAVALADSKVFRNGATQRGGGIFNNAGTTTLIRSEVERNTAGAGLGSGGGIFEAGGSVTLNKTKVRQNHPDNCAPAGTVPDCIG